MFHHGVQDRQPLAHTGRQGHLLGVAGGTSADVEGFEHRVVLDGDQRPHRQDGAPRGAPAPDGAAPPQGATVAIEGGHPAQGGEALAAPRAHRRLIEPQRPCTPGPKAQHTAVPTRRARARPDWCVAWSLSHRREPPDAARAR